LCGHSSADRGIGHQVTWALIDRAQKLGYHAMRLDAAAAWSQRPRSIDHFETIEAFDSGPGRKGSLLDFQLRLCTRS
jgi:hypothetical protein